MIGAQLDDMIQKLESIYDAYQYELNEMPEGKLLYSSNWSGKRYYHAFYQDGAYHRKGITKDKPQVCLLARKAYLEKAVAIIAKNLATMKAARRKYQPCDPDQIISELTAAYHSLPSEAFFDQRIDRMSRLLDTAAENRIASHKAWGDIPYEPADHMPEAKTIKTSRGELMRSKSEVMIAEMLYQYGIPFRYEQELYADGALFCPDFTFQGYDGHLFYLEFCGMMDNPEYVASFKRKRNAYESAGIYEWRNIIYIYSKGNDIDMMYIDDVIKMRVIPWL